MNGIARRLFRLIASSQQRRRALGGDQRRMRLLSRQSLTSLLPLVATASAFPTTFVTRNLSSDATLNMASSSTETAATEVLRDVQSALENSWVRKLSSESDENLERSRLKEALPLDRDDNRSKRPVFNGHYVLVEPMGLKEPRLVLYSMDVAEQLQLSKGKVESDEFLEWVSGNRVLGETWATPYALSIMGTRYTNNCPYGTGDGYGDGRAISIGELHGLELQLKGAGKTPFHRGADGRAVLRSSIREFLASEAMHYLGVATTRALSLVVGKDTIHRPWYTGDNKLEIPSMDDPRLKQYPEEQRKQILRQLRSQKSDPDIMIAEKAAITCRVASSFMRVGHIDLFARRAERKSMESAEKTDSRYDTSTLQWKELEEIIWHACYREFRETAYDPFFEKGDIASAATVLLETSAERLATMVANWVRVGFAQGNFNADNCLVGGKTMDYGPFGWMEEYNPVFAKWTGSGQHFGFLNQPSAGFANYNVLVESVVPVICAAKKVHDPEPVLQSFLEPAMEKFKNAVDEVLRIKLGFEPDQDVGDDVWSALEPLMRKSRADWTVLFRELTYIVRDFPDGESEDFEAMMSALEGDDSARIGSSPFYEPLDANVRKEWVQWIAQWRTALEACGNMGSSFERMRTANPKYVLREWMLVEAYSDAANGQEAELFDLYALIQHPYDEGTDREQERYYRRAPDEALRAGGTAFMS